MDRKGIIAVALAVITLFAWTIYNQREIEKATALRRAAAAEQQRKKAAEEPVPPAPAVSAPAPEALPPGEAPVEEKSEKLASPAVEFTFSNLGGGIASALLLTHEAERGKRMVINEFGSVPIGAISEVAGEGTRLPFTASRDERAGAVIYERTDARQLQITKRFTLGPAAGFNEDYALKLDVSFTNRGAQPLVLPGYFVHTGVAAPVHQRDLAIYTGLKAAGGKFIDVNSFSAGGLPLFGHPARPVYTESRINIEWLGATNQYFTTLISPKVTAPAQDPAGQTRQRGASVWGKRFDIADETWIASGRSTDGPKGARHGVQGALGMPGFSLEPGQSVAQSFTIYTGPREYSRLERLGGTEEQIMDFGMFGIVSKTLLNVMNWLHARLGSYAAAIIVLTLIIKTMLWPLQNKATSSMKRMQLLQPKITELKEKYPDDPTRMNTEMMKLYKDYGVNPLSGCLPMFIQIPIFFGFYNMLGKAVELRNSKFLWVQDLSQPDTIWHLPGLGIPVNVLPLVMAATMFWQMSISPKSGDPMQQRIFMFMPLIFIFFCYNFASALALYWAVQNLFSVAQLYVTRNQAPPQLQKAAPAKRK
ncbi:MAG: YidC/Oxa1 family rane protein insertase [Chthoniobacter sp.]|jgi:YidC/Oxa1 family membrane protein insertase|nr:YidC/Oxa1 family rane protein insertase [Chthoniobacter sp.]